jgi:hypothetical protein
MFGRRNPLTKTTTSKGVILKAADAYEQDIRASYGIRSCSTYLSNFRRTLARSEDCASNLSSAPHFSGKGRLDLENDDASEERDSDSIMLCGGSDQQSAVLPPFYYV